jgi:DNA-binding response OmpR family regulator
VRLEPPDDRLAPSGGLHGAIVTRVLLVEDDASLGRTLQERLERDGLEVTWAQTVAAARAAWADGRWALAILDVKLPDGSGFDLARLIRQQSLTPVMLMTALNSASSRLEGFETGADEYLPKPFHLREFLLRVRHILSTQRQVEVVRARGRTIDLTALTVTGLAGERVFLQTRDGQVLRLLMARAPGPVERSEILDEIWGRSRFPTARAVDNAIVRLRQALQDEGGQLIRSVRGIGYQWTPGEDR